MIATNRKKSAETRLPYPFNSIARTCRPLLDAAQTLQSLDESDGAEASLDEVKDALKKALKASFDALETLKGFLEESRAAAFYQAQDKDGAKNSRRYETPFNYFAFDFDDTNDAKENLERQIRRQRIVDVARSVWIDAKKTGERYRKRACDEYVWTLETEEDEIKELVDKFRLDDDEARRSYYDAKKQAFRTMESVASYIPLLAFLSFEESELEEEARNLERRGAANGAQD